MLLPCSNSLHKWINFAFRACFWSPIRSSTIDRRRSNLVQARTKFNRLLAMVDDLIGDQKQALRSFRLWLFLQLFIQNFFDSTSYLCLKFLELYLPKLSFKIAIMKLSFDKIICIYSKNNITSSPDWTYILNTGSFSFIIKFYIVDFR